jgi:hypothetical protein
MLISFSRKQYMLLSANPICYSHQIHSFFFGFLFLIFEKYFLYLQKIFTSSENKKKNGIYDGIYNLFLKTTTTTTKSIGVHQQFFFANNYICTFSLHIKKKVDKELISFSETYLHQIFQRTNKVEILKQC